MSTKCPPECAHLSDGVILGMGEHVLGGAWNDRSKFSLKIKCAISIVTFRGRPVCVLDNDHVHDVRGTRDADLHGAGLGVGGGPAMKYTINQLGDPPQLHLRQHLQREKD